MCVTEVCGILREQYSPDSSRTLAVDEHSGLSIDCSCTAPAPTHNRYQRDMMQLAAWPAGSSVPRKEAALLEYLILAFKSFCSVTSINNQKYIHQVEEMMDEFWVHSANIYIDKLWIT